MEFVSILFFFVMFWGLGFSITFFIKKKDDFFEKFFMNLAFGIAVFAILAAFFTVVHIPLAWYVFLILSLIIPVWHLFTKKHSFKFKLKRSHLFLIVVLILFIFTFSMYLKGSFAYQLYEDGDPWKHAGIAKYIAIQKTALEPFEGGNVLQYVDSYPPAYDSLMSVLYQVSNNLVWTMKFFNALLISLGIFFFYFFVKRFTGRADRALFATFILAMIPAYMSHFIWAHAIITLLLFILFYSIERLGENKCWFFPTFIAYAGAILIQPTQAFKLTLLVIIYLVVKSLLMKKVQWNQLGAVISGGILAFVVWWGPMIVRYGSLKKMILGGGTSLSVARGVEGFTLKFHGTADRIYTFVDFFFANRVNMINNPIGIGVVVMLLLFFTIFVLIWKYKHLLKEKNHWVIISGAMLLFTFLGVHGERLPVQLWAFRFWMLFAVFLSIFVSAGFFGLVKLCKKVKFPVVLLIVLIVLGVWFTSGTQKWSVNTGSWEHTAGEFAQYGNLDSWKYVADLPQNSNVFFPCRNHRDLDVAIMGVDQNTCLWCADEKEFKLRWVNETPESMVRFAQSKEYDYLFLDGNCFVQLDENVTLFGNYLQGIGATGVSLVHKSQGGFVFKI